ncbi:hypothetical protein P171DRAFT_482990 [Karstenula rhodostoma CBS 690.94]|uniref:Uncharacterized protein n=1 Tax=Karstenula rhodostoma CBS 690.94 TaxID=1392251 RepID=A0A9P4PQ34_9PLEO|nr:hypothetical protein P171DRAFT_482990 [Karstenula rhodostoma CBS 690.94]
MAVERSSAPFQARKAPPPLLSPTSQADSLVITAAGSAAARTSSTLVFLNKQVVLKHCCNRWHEITGRHEGQTVGVGWTGRLGVGRMHGAKSDCSTTAPTSHQGLRLAPPVHPSVAKQPEMVTTQPSTNTALRRDVLLAEEHQLTDGLTFAYVLVVSHISIVARREAADRTSSCRMQGILSPAVAHSTARQQRHSIEGRTKGAHCLDRIPRSVTKARQYSPNKNGPETHRVDQPRCQAYRTVSRQRDDLAQVKWSQFQRLCS